MNFEHIVDRIMAGEAVVNCPAEAILLADQRLQEYVVALEANGIAQHSAEWHQQRASRFGGSSMGTIEGLNPYQTVRDLAIERLGLTLWEDKLPCLFGTLFEEVIQRWCEYKFSTTIRGTDCFVLGPGPTCYSPDGLSIVTRDVECGYEDVITPDGDIETVVRYHRVTQLVLWEFKCPFGRIPSGRVPAYYVGQPKLGMEILLPNAAIFAEGVFRRCAWGDLGNNSVCDRTLSYRCYGALNAFGVIELRGDDPALQARLETLFGRGVVFDLGAVSVRVVTEAFFAFGAGRLKPVYHPLVPVSAEVECGIVDVGIGGDINVELDSTALDTLMDTVMDSAEAAMASHPLVCVLPWKLFHIDYHDIQREHGFLEKKLPIMNHIIDVVRVASQLPLEQRAAHVDANLKV